MFAASLSGFVLCLALYNKYHTYILHHKRDIVNREIPKIVWKGSFFHIIAKNIFENIYKMLVIKLKKSIDF